MNRFFFSLLLIFSFIIPEMHKSLYAQEQFISRYNISYVTMDDGLLHNNIEHIYKDELGFLWISTAGGGLSRYDGYDFIHFNTNTTPVSLRSNFILSVCEDNFNRLWIVSGEGTDILDLKTMQLVTLDFKSVDFSAILKQSSVNVSHDTQGNIWLYSGSSLYKISFESNGEIAFVSVLDNIHVHGFDFPIKDMDEDGNVWIGHNGSICKVYTSGDGKLNAQPISSVLMFSPNWTFHAFCRNENDIWIATNSGLLRYNRNQEMVRHYNYERENCRSISQNFVSDIVMTNDNHIIASTLQGLSVYNPVADDFERISYSDHPDEHSLNSNFINCMLVDYDIVWIGSATGGINKITLRELLLHNYTHDKDNPHSLSQDLVNAICEDHEGTLWVGTVEGGLNRKDPDSDRFVHYATETPVSLSHNTVSSLIVDGENRLWIGTWGWGITVLDLNHRNYKVVKYITPHEYPDLLTSYIGSLCYDPHNNGIWIGANPGIYFYDLETEDLISPIANDVVSKTYNPLGALLASDGTLWMGSIDGIFLIDLLSRQNNTFAYRRLKYKLDEPESGMQERVTCIYEASDHTIWVGSNGNGIYRYKPSDTGLYQFECYNTQHGLINNNVLGILEDEKGMLWISTNYGLSCFDPVNESFINYTKDDGLINNQFYWNAFCKASDGRMYFGGLGGLTVLEGVKRESAGSASKVVFTRFRVRNETISAGQKGLTTDISRAGEVRLHERDNSFSLEFSALNYKSRAATIYSYRLQGFEENWTDVPSTRRFAGYTNIPPGNYTFQVRYAADGSVDNCEMSELDIIICPYFYKTCWFVCLMVMLIGCVVVYLYTYRLYKLQKQKQLLHQKVEERTRELKEQNEKIRHQKEKLVEMSKKVQELTLDKLAFFTNITHEFRTPLTLILGPIERALKLSRNPQVIEQLHFVERNSKYLLSLINQLMDFRKIESEKLEIVRTKGDFVKFMDSLLTSFEVFAAERNIHIRKFYRMKETVILFDPDAMHKVVSNLMSNAIKFTPDGGTVAIYVFYGCNERSKKEMLHVLVKDTGVGIPEEDLSKIFNRFYQSRNHMHYPVYGQSGTGIGLYLCKQIALRSGGDIMARNNKRAGSLFVVKLPLFDEDTGDVRFIGTDEQELLSEIRSVSTLFEPGRYTILVVEDNRDMLAYINSILKEQYNVLEATNGAEALTLLKSNHVDFIISDLMMPVMDGIELSRKVKQNFTVSHIPFLMLTAKTSQEVRIESYRTGVDEYLQKPFNEELLLTRISNILENRKRQQQRFALNMEVGELQIDEDSSDKKFLDKAMHIVRDNYKNSYYEVTDFVTAMGASKSVINKKMQSLTGQSIGQFIRNYRLNIACEMIKKNRITRNMNISEIAYEVGFNDPKYFTRCFTKRYHMTPSSLLEEDINPDVNSM